MERYHSFSENTKHFHLFTKDVDIKKHVNYIAAKAGDPEAAFKLVEDLAQDFIVNLRQKIPKGLVHVAPYAKEATGDNALPLLLSIYSSIILSGKVETDIVQLQRVYHTGADLMERLISRPSFEGRVDKHAIYLLVDDVTCMGGTLAELANYIQIHGGSVFGILVLVNAGRSCKFHPQPKHITLITQRFGNEIKQMFGIHSRALTANEASYLVGFRTIDEIRNRRLKAEKEIYRRLLSKKII